MLRFWPVIIICTFACRFDPVGVDLDASANGTDASDTQDAGPAPVVELLRDGPFEDGTPVASIVDFADRAYVGPSQDGTSFRRITYDGEAQFARAMSLAADVSGSNQHARTDSAAFSGIGYNGCTVDVDCGPDNEDARGILASGVIAGTEWLILSGAKTGGDHDYVYMTTESGETMTFDYVDLSGQLGGGTKGVSAALVIQDRVFLGFPDTGGSKPYMVDLFVTPTSPGIDAVDGTDVYDLDGRSMPNLDGGIMIDVIAAAKGSLFIANNAGWVRTTSLTPEPSNIQPDQYVDVTPDSTDYSDKTSVATAKVGDLLPEDRAVPSFVEYQGAVYAARNTESGPQLWRCAAPTCMRADWSLIARNGTGDTQLSQFDNPSNTAITLLESTGTQLYVGFNNDADGVVLYRTSAAQPDAQSDFEGMDGCSAGPDCPGLGGNGLGLGGNTKFIDSEPIDVGGGEIWVYALVGDGVQPLRVYRFQP